MGKAFMIAATGSNCGKTTITCGLLKAFQQKNYRLGSYKCGPDYIDPMFHAQILGVSCKNLDLFFT
jgi:cobyrinic acid a,c-diamide synthase